MHFSLLSSLLILLLIVTGTQNAHSSDEQNIQRKVMDAGFKIQQLVATTNGTYELTLLGDISNLEFLKGMPLSALTIAGPEKPSYSATNPGPAQIPPLHICPVNDLTPLKGMPLKYLSIGLTHVENLSPLNGMRIEVLHLDHTQVQDLTPLKDMPIRILQLGYTRVKDLSPLKDIPIEILSLEVTDTTDLTPLMGSPLKHLVIWRTKISDITPLKGMALKSIILNDNPPKKGIEILRGMHSLELINYKSPDEFWRIYDSNCKAIQPEQKDRKTEQSSQPYR
jgi:hypothetical protein